ncbi:unnamed protein product [Rhizophagus irregularis]|nr:unnamed protein product [Rhizophagus irregularis]CAB5333131.1 unnamed protein product [Rhizophagus irregularis]
MILKITQISCIYIQNQLFDFNRKGEPQSLPCHIILMLTIPTNHNPQIRNHIIPVILIQTFIIPTLIKKY